MWHLFCKWRNNSFFYPFNIEKPVAEVRKKRISTPIIVGGPYPTSSYNEVLKDNNIDLAVIAEGELTIADILERTIRNGNNFPDKEELKEIPGIAFLKEK